ncbi:MAG TPA: hypothetical protein DCY89_09635 [Gammaproteobacteria bacterium]|nr:hypothetical protein [Gammaproteobacteria bacterium]
MPVLETGGFKRPLSLLLAVASVSTLSAVPFVLLPVESARADAYEASLVARHATLNLIEALVRRGVLPREEADQMIREAQAEAEKTVQGERVEVADPAVAEGDPGAGAGEADADAVHVYYVPEQVRESLREEITESVAGRVTDAVKASARKERWGIPAALPAWVDRFRISGDFRLRAENAMFAEENQPFSYFNFLAINRAGGLAALQQEDPQSVFLNTTEARTRFRTRLRLAIDSNFGDGLESGIRLSTSNERSPIGLNQTLGQTGQQYEVVIERLFAQYRYTDMDFDWLTVQAGRHPNPWFTSETMFDRDVHFEGLALTTQWQIDQGASTQRWGGSPFVNFGVSQPGSLYLTFGVSSLAEFEFSDQDRFLVAGQGGMDLDLRKLGRLKFGAGYFDYNNVAAVPNAFGRRDMDFTAPIFFTKGNSLARISNDIGETVAAPRLVGLAADFNIVDLTASYELPLTPSQYLILTASHMRNVGFSRREILERTGLDLEPRTHAYEFRLDIGNPNIGAANGPVAAFSAWGEWHVFWMYKHSQRDAVLDAFTESIFHLAGTDAEGWYLGGRLGITRDVFIDARWASSDSIDGPPLGIDVMLLDVNLLL